jgi:hypothetical protein
MRYGPLDNAALWVWVGIGLIVLGLLIMAWAFG